MFPGQGSQSPGMGRELLQARWAQETLAVAREITGLALEEIILSQPGELARTAVAQPAILLVEWLAWRALQQKGKEPAVVAGHSLGEFAALAAAGVFTWPEALRLVTARGQLMEEAAREHPGGMVAVLGLPREAVEAVARESGCFVANYNGPTQTVLAGREEELVRAESLAKEQGGKAVRLSVAGPFHSPYLEGAQGELARLLAEVTFHPPRCTFVSGVSGRPEGAPEKIAQLLARQMTSPVRWTEVLDSLVSLGVKEAWEVGPGEVLARLGKRGTPGIRYLALKEVMGHV